MKVIKNSNNWCVGQRRMQQIYGSSFIIVFLSLFYSSQSFAQKEYLDEVLKIVEEHSIMKDSIDLNRIRNEAYSRLGDNKSVEGCYPIIKFILSEIKDRHSFFMDKNQVEKWKSPSNPAKANKAKPTSFSGKMLNDNIGYIHMFGFSSGDSISLLEYANDLQALIKSLDNKKIKGWILDLRENAGGNCWPMLAGLGPLLGNGTAGYFIDNNRNKSGWYYKDGTAGVNSTGMCRVSNLPYKLLKADNRVAVLTGKRTASSGELIVTSFRGKSNSKSFGEETAGLTTGNYNYTLSDGSMLVLTTSVYADRRQKVFGGTMVPDDLIEFDYSELNTTNDSVIKLASEWICKK